MVAFFIVSLAFSLIECGKECRDGSWYRKETSHAGLWPGSLLLQGGGWGRKGAFASMPSCSITPINGGRSRSLQAAKLTLVAEDRDFRAQPPF